MSDAHDPSESQAHAPAAEPSTAEPRAPLPPPLLLATAGTVAIALVAIPLVYCSHVNGIRDEHAAQAARRRADREARLEARATKAAPGQPSGPSGPRPAPGEGPTKQQPAQQPAANPSGYTVVAVADGGTISGTIRWSGARPALVPLPITRNQDMCGTEVPFPALRIGEGDVVPDTVVFIEGIRSGKDFPPEPPMMDQQRCVYHPIVQVVGLGRELALRNSDGGLHNVHGYYAGDETWFNLAQPIRGMTTRRRADREGVARIVCDVHPWMVGWAHVAPHPYYAVSGDDGTYRIEGVPPGTYTIKAWHTGWRVTGTAAGRPTFSDPVVQTGSATVAASGTATVDFTFSE